MNTASPSLLEQVAGISGTVSKNIVAYREENGAFQSRKRLKKVPKLGPEKAFEQCAGFLRISESKNILDNTAVHPESYEAAEALLSLCGYQPKDLVSKPESLKEKLEDLNLLSASEQLGVGVPTLEDIRRGTAAARARSSRGAASPTAAYGCIGNERSKAWHGVGWSRPQRH